MRQMDKNQIDTKFFWKNCNKMQTFLDYNYEYELQNPSEYNNCTEMGRVMENYLQLVKRAKKGDTEAFAALYAEIYENMYRFALYTLRNTADAEDAVSEAVMEAFAAIARLRSEEAFKSWIFKILSNKCKDKLREYTQKTMELSEVTEQVHRMAGPEEGAIVRKIFFELSDEERLIIAMHLFCGYKSREIADMLHMNENTVRSKESRALKKLEGSMNA